MEAYWLLFCAFFGWFFALLTQYDNRAGQRFLWSRVGKKSILRKILPFKEDELHPLLYAKIIPLIIYTLILIGVFILYIIYWINPSLLSSFLNSISCNIIGLVIIGSSLLYSAILMI